MVRKLLNYRPRRKLFLPRRERPLLVGNKLFQVARNFHGRSQEFAGIEPQISEKIPRKFKTKDNCQAKLTERC